MERDSVCTPKSCSGNEELQDLNKEQLIQLIKKDYLESIKVENFKESKKICCPISNETPIYDQSKLPNQLLDSGDGKCPITFPDIDVWIGNKELGRVSHLMKKIWERTPGGDELHRKTLDNFANEYASSILKIYKKYKTKMRTANLLNELGKNLQAALIENAPKEPQTSLRFVEAPKYNFLVNSLKLYKPDLTHTFGGQSLGYRALIFFQQQQVMETKRKLVSGNSISFEEGFELDIPLCCGWLEFRFFEDIEEMSNIKKRLAGIARIDLFKDSLYAPSTHFDPGDPGKARSELEISINSSEGKGSGGKLLLEIHVDSDLFPVRRPLLVLRYELLQKNIDKELHTISVLQTELKHLTSPLDKHKEIGETTKSCASGCLLIQD